MVNTSIEPSEGRRNPWSAKPVHRILTFSEHGMTEEVVSSFLRSAASYKCQTIFDPFVGSGTVMVEAGKYGFRCIGQDSNPWSLIVSSAKTRRPRIHDDELVELIDGISEWSALVPAPSLHRYHTQSQIEMLGKLRAIVEKEFGQDKNLGLAILGKICVQYSRIRRSPAPKFSRRRTKNPPSSIPCAFTSHMLQALDDLNSTIDEPDVRLIAGDSSKSIPGEVDGILTSPPFANNIDYIRHTQLELLWSGLAKDSLDNGSLRSSQIPACEAAARQWKPGTTKRWILDKIGKVSSQRNYASFLSQYFRAMEEHFLLVREALAWEAWYTVGDSYFAGAHIPTSKMLERLAKESGFRTSLTSIGHRAGGRSLDLLRLRT